ncbi:MAG: exosortase/archaeosortase family protein [Planctomycetia bacterium]|nr:exosortase/archaeosortase family protein [Planctomycetia bacterium]
MAEQAGPTASKSSWLKKNVDQVVPWTILVSLLALLIAVYWNSLDYRGAMQFWDNPKYSHGWLVPIFTVILLWMRYEPFAPVTLGARWAGMGLLTAGLGLRLLTTYYPNRVPEMDSFVPSVAGIFLLVGGWKMIRWAGPAVVFLIFMFPLPSFLDTGLLGPLQKLATAASTYCLQTIGIPSYSDGNRIVIGEVQLGVVEACSGLRMLTIFVALAVAITLVTDRPIWERIVTIVSAVPIALAVNIVRITVTGILHLTAGPELAELVFHDLAGWVMMPMALGLLYVEFQILSHLIIEEGPAGPLQIGSGSMAGGRGPASIAGA